MSSKKEDIWPEDSAPESLYELAMNFIVHNLGSISMIDPITQRRKLKDGIILPAEICESLLQTYQRTRRINDDILNIFHDRSRSRLEDIKLRNSSITDEGFKGLLEHKPARLELTRCEHLSHAALDLINRNSDKLVSLSIGAHVYIISQEETMFQQQGYIIKAPNLRRLTIRRRGAALYPGLLLTPLSTLTHLDLSECSSLGDISCLRDMKFLISLILYNVYWLQDSIEWICGIRTLQHLDVSHSNDKYGKFYKPNLVLSKLILSLPNLVSLDISGTNLAGSGSAAHMSSAATSQGVRCDIPGLSSRVKNPLNFLGLYGTQHAACRRHDIPALIISGDGNEDQILTAAVAYMDRPEMLTRVLNDLYHLFRYENNAHIGRALNIVMEAMNRHVTEKHIQISGSATLFYIVKGKKNTIAIHVKRKIITALLTGMEFHSGDETMMRNGCLSLCQFKIPSDVIFEYERIVTILLRGVSDNNQEGFVQRIAIYLLNSLACQVDGKQKQFLGDCGAISEMLALISDRLVRHHCDDVLEVAWSTMWNVTDETPANCRRFLDAKGMEYFLGCLKSFPDKEELLRNMMGLLGNIAEVSELRSHLMTPQFLSVFYDLLDSSSDGIEVSYNAAGVLAHIASDGASVWTVAEPARDVVLGRMQRAVDRWDLRAERNINYRSFEPILGLLLAHHTPQCQHWAVWALANLTTVYPDKYCTLVEAEGGTRLLYELISHPNPYSRIKELAATVLHNCHNYKHSAQLKKTTDKADSSPE